MSVNPEEAAQALLETIPVVMRAIRAEMRRNRESGLNVPQFRTLMFIHRQPGASLSDVSDHLGLTPATTSKLVDGLVERALLERQTSTEDRRRITLSLTPRGFKVWEAAFRQTKTQFTGRLAGLSQEDLKTLKSAMQLLDPLFNGNGS